MLNRWSRRRFIATTASVLASCATAQPARREQRLRVPILIIGAGLSGLAAADELTRQGHDVLVVEARARAGGRVLTLREPFDDGLHVEAGAMYVGRGDELVRRYVSELGLRFAAPPPDLRLSSVYHLRGQRIVVPHGGETAWPFDLTDAERAAGFAGLWKRHVRTLADRYLAAAREGALGPLEGELDAMSFADSLRAGGASDAVIDVFRTGYLDAFGDGFASVSAFALVRELARPRLAVKPAASFDRLEGGSDRLPSALAVRLGNRIRYETRVERIEQNSDGVDVVATNQSKTIRILADRVIAAVPPRVLSGIAGGGLSDERRRELRALGSTSVARVFFQCRRRFWQDRNESGAASTDRGTRWIIDDTSAQRGPRGIVSAYVTADTARRWSALGEADRVAAASTDVGAVHLGLAENVERFASYCWDSDPLAQGAHAAPSPGQMQLVRKLARPEGRISFAGEHVSEAPGWMEGALASGLLAAQALRR